MIFLSILILIVAIALPSINQNIRSILYVRISSIIFIYAGALAFNAFYIQSIGSGIGVYSGLFQVTTISQLLDVLILLIGSLILISWPSLNISKVKLTENIPYAGEYSLIVLFSTFGASLLVSSADLISMYLSIELQSFGVYILTTLYRDSESATSAGLKYFLLGSLSSCIILLGSGLVYTYTGLTNLESIYNLISVSENTAILQGLSLGIVLIIVGYLFKVSAAPLHNWAPALCSGKTHKWVKLPNSGDTLKLMVPSYIRKIISGQNNYLGMVTSHKMTETEMGYRGSKSEFIIQNPQPKYINSVKEQRVDGGYCKKPMQLRCTLMGFERNYQIKNPSKQLRKQYYTTLSKTSVNNELNPWFITGFADAEGCFSFAIKPDARSNLKWLLFL